MADFKELVGEEIYTQIADKIGDKKIIVADKDGDYIPYSRFKEVNDNNKSVLQQVEDYKKQIEELTPLKEKSGIWENERQELIKAKEELENNYKKELYTRDFNSAFSKLLSESECIDDVALKAHLKMDDIKLEEGKLIGAEEQIAKLKEEKKHLFKQNQPADKPIFKAGGKVVTAPQKSDGIAAATTVKPWNKFRS